MNGYLSAYARKFLKDGLAQLPERNQLIFKRMYSHKNLDKPIDAVVDAMPDDKLDWAMMQVQRTLDEQPARIARDGIEAQHGLNDTYPGDPYP
jgi:hypothetical protein